MTNSADPDQLAFSEANSSGSTLFAMTGHVVFSKRRVKQLDGNANKMCIRGICEQYTVSPLYTDTRYNFVIITI